MIKKNLEHYINLPYAIKLSRNKDNSYFAQIEELPGCITEGETKEEALLMIEDAKKEWIKSALEDNAEIPEPIDQKYSGKLNLRLPKSLHKYLVVRSNQEGVSLNTYIITKLANKM
jgi:antitoxin HicB